MQNKTAILIDGGFFIKRAQALLSNTDDPVKLANLMYAMAMQHIKVGRTLYRIFYYDCPPYEKKHHTPIGKKSIDFSKSEVYEFKQKFYSELKKKRSVAIRFGNLRERYKDFPWTINPSILKKLLEGKIRIDEITDENFKFDIIQKGVDMKIGLDISSLAYKKLVDQIVLISGDSDFVPAAKLARREGIDFILDPIWNPISDELFEHIDGLTSTLSRSKKSLATNNNILTH